MLMSTSKIKLNQIQKQKLLKIKQKSQTETVRDRAHAILLRHQGFTIEQTAQALLRSDKFIKHAAKLHRQEKLTETHFQGNHHTKLTKQQRDEIIGIIRDKCPNKLPGFNFKEQFWSTDILKIIIKQKYQAEYKTEKSYYDLFKRAGFSFHKPKIKDFRQNPAKMKQFKGALKKSSETTRIRLSW
ncbi:hypothetical protein COV49_04440 [Candidatus Falkowbacteria bacterium CG11_big_fil_rev_8_21_14_0_20_39_10]|uniref:Winged helix-turn helix domain-containing protein n=1 Tax=Candidatus Falkowbacteria bacterium CG11_big_fil_rev_8_21_14_0_20_39_10 TaxID=1974570 RepID=A0A2M6K7V5_9BACT|nr:MAG: hypothetical protein COV49_04440 [Candidatus Falkowbacteria bacterium CG11_big_fil_rev_8_21_14_0_20_39_10]